MSLKCAVLARKSNQQEAAGDEKSVALQERECRALIERNGWELADGHLYVEDAVSGALMTPEGRPELFRLLAACESKDSRPFDVVVVSHEDRLGRDMYRTGIVAKRIIDAGVRLFSVASGERRLDTATDDLLMAIGGFGAQLERESASRRTRAKAFDSARRGHATGARPFGYDMLTVGGELRGHKELRVNEARAEIVRWIFDLASQGFGCRRIAWKLNEEHPSIRKWSVTRVRDILLNETYVGRVTFGTTRAKIKDGRSGREATPAAEWVVVEHPELRIVPQALWEAVQARKAATFATYLRGTKGQLSGKPEGSVLAGKYLLSGMIKCGICGARMGAITQHARAGGKAYRYYACWRARSRGRTACTNSSGVPMDRLHDMLVTGIKRDVLTPARIEQVARDLAAAERPELVAEQRLVLEAELRRVEARLGNLAAAVGEGGEVKTLLRAIRLAEREEEALRARLDSAAALQKASALWDTSTYRARVMALLEDWQRALEAAPQVARQILRKLLTTDITITPGQDASGAKWFDYAVSGTFHRIWSGQIGLGSVMTDRLTEERPTLAFDWVTMKAYGVPVDPVEAELGKLVKAQPNQMVADTGTSVIRLPGSTQAAS